MTQSTNQNKTVRLFTEKHVENLESIFQNLYKDEILSDVTFHCKDGSVKAHKAILASCSAYFRKVFFDHNGHEAVYIMYGVSVKQMRNLIELIYRGSTEVSAEVINNLYDIADEMGVKGVVCEENGTSNSRLSGSPSSTHTRDTRFRGTKRVAVNFQEDEYPSKRTERILSSPGTSSERTKRSGVTVSSSESSDMSTVPVVHKPPQKLPPPHISNAYPLIVPKTEPPDEDSDRIEATIEQEVNEIAKKTAWQLKQRKFACHLCSASFKRASHLSRHQLVHTGERPWPCQFCEKAFSRHDKLKNHVRKNHEENSEDSENIIIDVDNADDSLYTIGHVQILNPMAQGTYDPYEEVIEEPTHKVTREDLEQKVNIPRPPTQSYIPPPEEPLQLSQDNSCFENIPQETKTEPVSPPQKKGRGRPRKYPPTPKPLFKRPRGRPRANGFSRNVPYSNQSMNILLKPGAAREGSNNYDITNMPFGDLASLMSADGDPSAFMEPYVEIETDQKRMDQEEREFTDASELLDNSQMSEEEEEASTARSFLENIGLSAVNPIGQIGQCTISLTGSSGCPNTTSSEDN